MARIVFMGTPEFAVPTLVALCEHHQVVGVVTQPDRRAGRGRKLVESPIKQVAVARDLDVFQPPTLRNPDAVAHLAQWRPEVIVVAAFGQILRPDVLELPPHGCINVHASLLPCYRGASPVAAAILAGEAVTGVTIIRMDEGMDTGPILAREQCEISPQDTTETLAAKLAELGAGLLIRILPAWLRGDLVAQPQDEELATCCHLIHKKDGEMDWSETAQHLASQVRACCPWPGTFTTWQGKRLKILAARARPEQRVEGVPGLVVLLDSGIGVVTAEGVLELLEVQLAGKRASSAESFANGQRDWLGSVLGT